MEATARLELRSRMLKGIRDFFHSRGYLEADTPLLAPAVIPEAHLDYFCAPYREERSPGTTRGIIAGTTPGATPASSPGAPLYLLPSPELWLKRLLARGSGPLFEISRAFRNCEQRGRHHNPEFTLLEWYRTEGDHRENISETLRLLEAAAALLPDPPEILTRPPEILPMAEAFRRWAGMVLTPDTPRTELLEACRRRELSPAPEDTWEVLFNRLFLSLVEPSLPADRPLFLTDYPPQIASLAQTGPSGWAQRWELYLGGVELANCYQEERDPRRLRRFFTEEAALRKEDPAFPPAWEALIEEMTAMPPCSGAALGLDRLIMTAAGETSLEGVILFPFPDILPNQRNNL